uniref:Uncharacterized protein n=1 Tax=viral metagenome TaxID=1070528 RepID=A0A6C0K470_9ZZZZ
MKIDAARGTNRVFINYKSDNINSDDGMLLFRDRVHNECTLDKSESENTNDREEKFNCNDINAFIYRFKFTQNFMDELYKFSKIHQYDDRKSFKEAWETWTDEQEELIEDEISRLDKLGYDGDVPDKMFKSARYYFRKKGTSKPEPKERKKYVGVHKDLLDAMDLHIFNGRNSPDYKPSDGFVDFCKTNTKDLKDEIARLLENNLDSSEIMSKIKKTYKNRYFISITK